MDPGRCGSFNAATNDIAAPNSGVERKLSPTAVEPMLMALTTALCLPRPSTFGGGGGTGGAEGGPAGPTAAGAADVDAGGAAGGFGTPAAGGGANGTAAAC